MFVLWHQNYDRIWNFNKYTKRTEDKTNYNNKKRRSNQREEIKKIHATPLIIEGLIWNENNNSRLCGIEKNPKKEILLTKLELGM